FADIEGAFSAARFAPMTLIGGRLNQISVQPAKIGFRSPRATRTSRIGARSFAASAHVGSWHVSTIFECPPFGSLLGADRTSRQSQNGANDAAAITRWATARPIPDVPPVSAERAAPPPF